MKRADWRIDWDCRRQELLSRPHHPLRRLSSDATPSIAAYPTALITPFVAFEPVLARSHQRLLRPLPHQSRSPRSH